MNLKDVVRIAYQWLEIERPPSLVYPERERPMLKAIETHYKGYRFRSRLEARWAVFFDAMGIDWQYEPEGFELGDGVRYLPDFKIENGLYVEIKPDALNDEEQLKIDKFSDTYPIVVAIGLPEPRGYKVYEPDGFYGWGVGTTFAFHHGQKGEGFERMSPDYTFGDSGLEKACEAARSARFEFGESGD
jgi:hypothetical protein